MESKDFAVVSVDSPFRLRLELEKYNPETARLIVIDQSYTLRDPHLLPKDAKPSDLRPLPAPDWKPLLEKRALFRPTVRDFLVFVTGDDHWPAEVNIFPYEKLAREDASSFVQAYDTFRRTGRALTTSDLILVGASTVFELNLFEINDPLEAVRLAFHAGNLWNYAKEFFNSKEIDTISRHLRELPSPMGDLFSSQAENARLAIAALLVLGQHFDKPGMHLPVLSTALAHFQDCVIEFNREVPSWFVDEEIPRFEKLLSTGFRQHLQSFLELDNSEKAKQFAGNERLSPELRSMVSFEILVDTPEPRRLDAFSLDSLVPEFMETKRILIGLCDAVKGSVERLRLTPVPQQSLKGVLQIFVQQEFYRVEHLIGRLESLIYYIEGPGTRHWPKINGFEKRWKDESSKCRDLIVRGSRLRDDLDITFGRLLESKYSELIQKEVLPTDRFYESFIGPRRRTTGGRPSKAVILVFDSMRFDIWRGLVKPMFEKQYTVEEQVGFALLPSETRVSRRSFFAGKPPSMTPRSGLESDHFAALISSFHGMKIVLEELQESRKRPGLAFLTQSRDRITTAGVFDFADLLSHKVDWDPNVILEMSKPLLREVEALLSSMGPEAKVFVTADHGHVLPHGRTPVLLDDATDVGYRSAYVSKRVEGHEATRVFQIQAAALRHDEPGWFVFPRPGFALQDSKSTKPFRPGGSYRHGGLSLYEIMVPLACLTHREAPTVVRLSASVGESAVVGRAQEITISLSAEGVISSPVMLTSDTEGVESLALSEVSTIPRTIRMRFTPTAPGRQTIRIEAHLAGELVGEAVLEITVAPAPVEIDKGKLKLSKLFGED
jgi:hypothetical protein